MSLGIVHFLKIIQIHNHKGGRHPVLPIRFQEFRYPFPGSFPVQESCKWVPSGLLPVGADPVLILRVIQHHGIQPDLSLIPFNDAAAAIHPAGTFILPDNTELRLKELPALPQLLPAL